MKKIIAWLLAIALTATVSIGATLAYLTDTDEDVNVMTLGKVKIDQLEYERVDVESKDANATVQEFHDNKPLLPAVTKDGLDYAKPGATFVDWEQIGKDGYTSPIWNPELINNEVDKMVFVKNKGDYDAFVRSVFAFEAGKYTTLDQFKQMVHLNLNETDYEWEWLATPVTIGESTYFVATATYNKVLAPGALTEISLSQIALDSSATNADVEAFGETYQVLVKSQGIQADGFTDPDTALNEGFKEITSENIPWTSDQPIKGIDVRTALHYENGDSSKAITTKVTNVVFGLNKDYPSIVDNYDGVLVTDGQDVDVHSYYVEKDGFYTVYFLSNSTIYSPKDSSGLFMNMSALQKVDTSNFDVSRVESMYNMFCYCGELIELDVSNWDTGNVTTMERAFKECRKLQVLDVENWNMSNVRTILRGFQGLFSVQDLEVGKWDTSNIVDMGLAFQGCKYVEKFDVENWDVSNVKYFNSLFASWDSNNPDMSLSEIDVSKWDTSSAEKLNYMFYGCGSLKEIDLSTWDVTNVNTTYHMFADCYNLESVNFTGWNTPNLTNMDGMFNDCHSLVTVDLSDLDTANVTDMSQLFEYCYNLKEVKGLEKWDTSKVWDFKSMFFRCDKLEVLDLSGFNTSNAKETYRMFRECYALQTIYVGDGWDMSKVTNSSEMFTWSNSLVGGNGTVYNNAYTDVTYARVDAAETPGYLTYKAAEENANP